MNNSSFVRKIIYLVAMAVLLVPLYLISAPSFIEGGVLSEGGKLTQLRDDYGLAQSNLGEIDPASESMKLATLGMRGVAANILWERANEYKKKEEWDNLRATLNQIAKLQPNFISVWQFQAWNLSYNVSVEFDNYEHRYHWVKKGIEFLMQGIRYNRNEPRLLWDLGWFFGHKVGRSDEYIQFRREYNNDDDFHQSLDGQIDVEAAKDFKGDPDNWLTAHQWFNNAQRVVDLEGVPIKGKNPLVFHSDSAKSLIRYADAIEAGGGGIKPVFGEVARLAWERANVRWLEYGDREIPTSYGYKISLNSGEKWTEMAAEREQAMEELAPGLKDKLTMQRLASLTDEEKRLLAADRAGLNAEEYDVAVSAQAKATITPADIVAAIEDPVKRREAKLLTNRIAESKAFSTTIRRYRDIVNFIYWRTRCEVEQEDRAIEGRQLLWEAENLAEEADLIGAVDKYDEAWKRWSTIHNDHPILAEDVTAEDLVDQIKEYRTVLTQLDRDFPPKDFPMLRLVANYADEFGISKEEAQRLLDQAERTESMGAGAGTGIVAEDPIVEDSSDADEAGEAGDDADQADTGADTATAEAADPEEEETPDDATESSESQPAEASSQSEESSEETAPAVNDSGDNDSGDNEAAAADDDDDAYSTALAAADEAYRGADLATAKSNYEAAWQAVTDPNGAENLISQIRNYRVLLGQLDEAFPPANFPLLDFVKSNAEEFGYTADEAAALGN